MILKQTHYFQFTPTDSRGLADYTLQSGMLVNPEYMPFPPCIIAGLEDEDVIRLKFYPFSDKAIGEIYTLVSEEGETVSDDIKYRNRRAIRKAELFVAMLSIVGFCENKIRIKKGKSPIMMAIESVMSR